MVEPPVPPKQEQAIAHSRGRICKVRTCTVCAPLREERRRKKAQRKADAQTKAHERGVPCGRANCSVPVCVEARHADPSGSTAAPTDGDAPPIDDVGAALRRQADKHRAGLPCGFETCVSKVCVEGFAQERARRHRARRPCRSTECANPICVAARTSHA
jgi:hypothetical protein